MTITPNVNLNAEACQIEGNKLNGRITLVTGNNSVDGTLCRVSATDEGGGYGTDSVNVFPQQRAGTPFIQVMPAGEDSSGWEVFTEDLLQANSTYVFNYHVEIF